MSTDSIGAIGQQGQQNPFGGDAMNDISVDDFLEMLIAEMQHQDPLNPMDNSQILQQISQIREIKSNDELSETLQSLFLGQNVASASGMIGKWVMKVGDNDDVQLVGRVERVMIENGVPTLNVEGFDLDMESTSKMQVLSDPLGEKMDEALKMVDKEIRAITDGTQLLPPQEIVGRVDNVVIVGGTAKYRVGRHIVDPENVIEVINAAAN